MSDQNQTCPLPNEIITQILTRLPAKPINRFKCVSKTWYSLICNPHFISSYISHNSPSSDSWVIVDRYAITSVNDKPQEEEEKLTHFNMVEVPNISSLYVNPHKLVANDDEPSSEIPVIIASSNGLLLLTVRIKRDPYEEHKKNPNYFLHSTIEDVFFVINPITGKWVHLVRTPKPINKLNSVGFVTKIDSFGVVEKFVVVEYQPLIGSDEGSLLCFNSDTGKWFYKACNYMLGMHFWRAEEVFELDGRLFWIDRSCGIIAWDDDPLRGVEEEHERGLCRFIPLPDGCWKPFNTPKLEDKRDIFGSGGYIHYMEMFKKGDYVLKLWRLKDYRPGGEEWSLVYNVSRMDVEIPFTCGLKKLLPRPCFNHPFEVDIVFFNTDDHILSYNFRTGRVETVANFTGHEYVIPFVLPRWPTSLPPRLYATYAKEEGNAHFKIQKFDEAVKCYSRSIALSPNAFSYANRALVYFKLSRFCEAEDDCTKALELDSNYVKVYARRALVRKEVGNLKGSMEDLEFALKLEPKNQILKKQHAEIKSLLEKASCI